MSTGDTDADTITDNNISNNNNNTNDDNTFYILATVIKFQVSLILGLISTPVIIMTITVIIIGVIPTSYQSSWYNCICNNDSHVSNYVINNISCDGSTFLKNVGCYRTKAEIARILIAKQH